MGLCGNLPSQPELGIPIFQVRVQMIMLKRMQNRDYSIQNRELALTIGAKQTQGSFWMSVLGQIETLRPNSALI